MPNPDSILLTQPAAAELPPGALTAEQAARYLSVSVPTLRRLTNRGLRCVRLGGRILRYRRRDLEAYLDQLQEAHEIDG